jgi:hypothetical protein
LTSFTSLLPRSFCFFLSFTHLLLPSLSNLDSVGSKPNLSLRSAVSCLTSMRTPCNF